MNLHYFVGWDQLCANNLAEAHLDINLRTFSFLDKVFSLTLVRAVVIQPIEVRALVVINRIFWNVHYSCTVAGYTWLGSKSAQSSLARSSLTFPSRWSSEKLT